MLLNRVYRTQSDSNPNADALFYRSCLVKALEVGARANTTKLSAKLGSRMIVSEGENSFVANRM